VRRSGMRCQRSLVIPDLEQMLHPWLLGVVGEDLRLTADFGSNLLHERALQRNDGVELVRVESECSGDDEHGSRF